MNKSKDLEKYCNKMLLEFEILENSFLKLNNNTYEIVDGEQMLFDEDFNFIPITNHNVNGFVYEFCGRWYLQGLDENATMQELKYIGNCKAPIETSSFIGIHSGNELLNGVGLYKDWVKKAKFLGVQNLGICEKNTLRGALSFQEICKKEGLRHIIGMSFSVNSNDEIFVIKCYCKDFQGWQNLLKFSYELNVEQNSAIKYDFLKDNLEGLYIVIDPKESVYKDYSEITDYYQLDTVKFEEEFKDASYIDNLELFLKSEMKPILLCDAYYIEQSDYIAREKLWGIAKSFDYRTKNQHFKSDFEVLQELSEMFDNNTYKKLFEASKSNLKDIVENCNFEYDTTSRHLPKYQMTKEESEKFKTKEDLFNHCLESGLSELDLSKDQKEEYLKRVNYEVSILKRGNVVDYFLFTRDLVNFAKKNNVLTGIARGSAGGSIVSYLLKIIAIDPIEHGLLFERFLNEGRMGSLEQCMAYSIKTSEGNIQLNEKSVLKVLRNSIEKNIFVEDLQIEDIILGYE